MFRNIIVPQSTPAMPPRIPPPSYRHSGPSGPWPFLDIEDEVTNVDDSIKISKPLSAVPCRHTKRSLQETCWCRYPQSLFPNWTPQQQKKSRIMKIIQRQGQSSFHYLDIMQDGAFVNTGVREFGVGTQDSHWAAIQRGRPPRVKTRAIFVENLTGPALQMLGTRYNIEPFFFSSSIGWIPSRYQSNLIPNQGDHITITLVFIRPTPNPTTVPPSPTSTYSPSTKTERTPPDLMIDTQSPLLLRSSDLILYPELLALHVIRSPDSSTIISYHPTAEHRATSAASMHARMHSTGHSVYWSRMLKGEKDPTLAALSMLWYAMYAWDEALDVLYAHICLMESEVLVKNDAHLTREMHLIRAHLLHYESLLRDFQRTVLFVQNTPFPSLQNPEIYTDEERLQSEEVMKRETGNLLSEIRRLEKNRAKYSSKLKNVMDLGFSMVNIRDSTLMQQLTKSTVRDSSAMKQLSYLTMVFFPASFVANVFGMNITLLNPQGGIATMGQYCALVVPLTLLTIWIVVALEINIKEVTVHRMSCRNRTGEAVPAAKGPFPIQHAIIKANGDGKYTVIEGHDGGDELCVELVEVRYSYNENHKERVVKEGEMETVKELNIWTQLGWPYILLAMALEKRQRRQKEKAKTSRVDANTKTE